MSYNQKVSFQMKKKEEKPQGLTLDFLEKKYQEEKQILAKQNKKLAAELNQEMERNSQLQMELQKNEKVMDYKYEELLRENQQLKAKILQLSRQEESFSINEEHQFESLKENKRLLNENQSLKQEYEELVTIIVKMQEQKKRLEDIENQLHEELQQLQNKHIFYKKQSESIIQELTEQKQAIFQEKQREATKYSEQKKKKKELERKIDELEKLSDRIKYEQTHKQEEIQSIRIQKEREHEKYMQLSTKFTLSEAKISSLQAYISKTEEQLKESQKKLSTQLDLNQEFKYKLDKLTSEYRNLEEDSNRLRAEKKRLQIEVEKSTLSKEEIIKAMRKSETEELIGLIRQQHSDLSQKMLHKYPEGGSSNQSVHRPFIEHEEIFLERGKMETIINNLEGELTQSRKQIESTTYQLNRLKRSNEDKTLQLQRKESEIRQYKLRVEKSQTDRNRQLITLRNENQLLKCRQTQKLERAKQVQEYKTAMSLKLAFYERKIKEHLDTIDRKQTIIQKLQLQKNDMEDKIKIFQDHIRKMGDEMDFLKKFKQDCNRKDQLMKDYKSKLEKIKQEAEDLKSDLTQTRKDKNRIQKQIESKDQYIASLKAKIEKNPQQKVEDVHKQNKKLSQVKNSYENKLSQIRREREELSIYLHEIREIIMNKVDQCLAKQIPVSKKQVPQYEAAKLLGIKPGEIEQFLNPSCMMNKKISKQLQDLWLEGSYSDFVIRFIDYFSTQQTV